MKKFAGIVLSVLLAVACTVCACAETPSPAASAVVYTDPDAYLALLTDPSANASGAVFAYEYNPADNPKVLADAVVNPEAVFGFSPNPDSPRLKDYVDVIDWTDPLQVLEARASRREYHESMSELYRLIEAMLAEAKPVEEIARAVSVRRNEIRLEAYDGDPDGLARVKQSNLDTYGDESGPTPDFLYQKYGSWQAVLEKALGTNAGMDACLGFYDEFFEMYDIGQ